MGALSNRFSLAKILLWEHETRILSGELKEWTPLLPLMGENSNVNIIDTQKKLLAQVSDPRQRADLIAAAMIVAMYVFGKKIVMEKFKKELPMLKETSIVQNWLAESLLEGKLEGKLSTIKQILTYKLGELPSPTIKKLEKLEGKQLDRLGKALLIFKDQRDLQAWLKNGVSRRHSNGHTI